MSRRSKPRPRRKATRIVGRTRARCCEGKKRHPSQRQAAAHRARLVAGGASSEALQVYDCRVCDGWHVGHRPARRR